jgi:hypothetical protein
MLFCQDDLFLGIRAAYGRTIAVSTGGVDLSGTDALDPGYSLGMLFVGSAQYFALVWPGGAHQSFIVHAGDHVLHLSVAIFIPHFRVKWLKARRQNDRPYFYFYLLRRLTEIDGVIFTDCFANATFLLFQVKTAFVDVSDQRNGLSEIDMDGFVL